MKVPCHEKTHSAQQTGTVSQIPCCPKEDGGGQGDLALLGTTALHKAFPKSGRPLILGPEAPSLGVARLGKDQQGHLESWAETVGGSVPGPGAVALIIFCLRQLWGPASCNICLTVSPETALFRRKMKNIRLGLVVFLCCPNSSGPLGGETVSRAPPPQGQAEAGAGMPRFFLHLYPGSGGRWDTSSVSPGAQSGDLQIGS